MPVKAKCKCGKVIAAPDKYAGKLVKCPACQEPLQIPSASASEGAAPKRTQSTASKKKASVKKKLGKASSRDTAGRVQNSGDASDFIIPGGIIKRFIAFFIDGLVATSLAVIAFVAIFVVLLGAQFSDAISSGNTEKITEFVGIDILLGGDVALVEENKVIKEGEDEEVLETDKEVAGVTEIADGSGNLGINMQDAEGKIMALRMSGGIILAVIFGYFFFFEMLFAGTLGKLIVGLRVVNKDTEKVGFGGALVRNLFKMILGLLSCIVAVVTGKKQAIHDMAAGTYVVNRRDVGAAREFILSNKKSSAGNVKESSSRAKKPARAKASSRKAVETKKKTSKKSSKKVGKKVEKKTAKKVGKKVAKKSRKKI